MDRPQQPRTAKASWKTRARARFADLATRVWPDRPSTWAGTFVQIRPHLSQILRLTLATVAAYLVIRLVFPTTTDITGPLTALLVVQASSVGTLQMGVLRVFAVLTGVLIAVGVSTIVGLTWWSLGLVVFLGLLAATILRLRDQLIETPISAMLILGASVSEVAAENRLVFTLVGAAVGVALVVVLPPSLPMSLAGSRVRQVADQLADQLSTAGETLAQSPVSRAMVDDWIGQLRGLSRPIDTAADEVERVTEGRRLNTRAIVTADVAPLLRSGLETLESCWLSIRALFVLIRNEIPEGGDAVDARDDDLRAVFAVALHHSSSAIREFGELVELEADGREEEAEFSFAISLEMLREAKAILTELMLTGASNSSWLLRRSTLSAVEQVLDQLDLESRSKVRAEWEHVQSQRFGAQLPVLVRDALPQAERPLPRLVERGLKEVVSRERGAQVVRGSQRVWRGGRRLFGRLRPPASTGSGAWEAITAVVAGQPADQADSAPEARLQSATVPHPGDTGQFALGGFRRADLTGPQSTTPRPAVATSTPAQRTTAGTGPTETASPTAPPESPDRSASDPSHSR